MQGCVMDEHEFPQRMFTVGYEPEPDKSIHYFSGKRILMDALHEALNEDEWEELRNSALGVFVNFYDIDFIWCSRMVHYMLSMQLQCDQKYEIWSLVGNQPVRFSLIEFEHLTGLNCDYVENLEYPEVEYTSEMRAMWELLGVGFEVGPSYRQLVDACSRCHTWTRQQRIWLGYLGIYTSFIESQHWTAASRADLPKLLLTPGAVQTYPWGRLAFKYLIESLKKEANKKLQDNKNYQIEGFAEVLNIWIYWACPGVAAIYGNPFPNNPIPPVLAYQGSRHRKKVDETLRQQTRINGFIRKEYADMFPKWDNAGDDDEKIVNILRVMYGQFQTPWRWSYRHWPANGAFTIPKKDVKKEGAIVVMPEAKGKVKGKGAKRKLDHSPRG